MIDRVDRPALEMLATAYSAGARPASCWPTATCSSSGARGQLKQNPAVRVERDAATVYMRIAEHFGVTPIARSRLGLAEIHRRSLEAEMATALAGEGHRRRSRGR